MSIGFKYIEDKIHQLIKKYYLNKVIKGMIFSIAIFLIFGFILLLIEYFLYLSPLRKSIILILYAISLFSTVLYFIFLPVARYLGFFNKVSQKKVNQIIVNHFPDIKDRLWNLLELKYQNKNDLYSEELLLASINQKIDCIKPYDFTQAISLKNNLKFAYYLLLIVFTGSLLTIISPDFVKSSTQRLSNYKTVYIKPSPYSYKVLNEQLSVGKGENYKLEVFVNTDRDYDNFYIQFGNNIYLMKNEESNLYSYLFSSINSNVNFQFLIDGYYSEYYTLKVLPKPFVRSFKIEVIKPKYTSFKDESFENLTELVIPVGSDVSINFNAVDTDTIVAFIGKDTINLIDQFIFNKQIYENELLYLSLVNEFFTIDKFLNIDIKVIRDEYPGIYVEKIVDETDFTRIYFRGIIEDDYGFEKLNFITKINNNIDSIHEVEIFKNYVNQDFLYAYDFKIYKSISNSVEYYFEIFDNDMINGSKSTKSETFNFSFPNSETIFDYQDNQHNNIEQVISESMMLTRDIQKDMQELQEKLINSDLKSWERNELIKNISSKKQQLEDALKSIQEKNKELSNYLESFTEQDRDIIEKQQQIQQILEEIISDELRQLIEEFNKMMEEFDEGKMNNLKEKMDISLDDLQEQLDRNLEMLKKMKMEQQLDKIKSDIDKQIEEQQNLLDELEKDDDISSQLNKQNEEREKFQKLEEQYKKLEELNKELNKPLELNNFDNEFDDIQNEFGNSIDKLNDKDTPKSKESIQNNKQKMQDLSSMMEQMMDMIFAEQRFENLQDLIQMLDNVVTFSFNQEDLLIIPTNNVFDSEILNQQKKLYQDFGIVKDSLYALAKREPSVNLAVNKEIVNIENNFRLIDRHLSEGRVTQAKINMQLVFTSANEIALFLSEVIKQLQQQLANSMPGNQNCQKPGNNPSGSSMGDAMKNMQKSLQEQLEKMMQMKEGGKESQMDGEIGKALARQEKLQNMLQKMMNQGNLGSEATETLKQADQLLNKIQEDILRNNISDRTINRNKEILTRLLQAENAEMERDIDEKREPETAKEQLISETAKYFENINANDKFEERLLRQKLLLNRYYQNKYQTYINQLDSISAQ